MLLFEVPEFALDVFEVELLADAPFDAFAVWFAEPETAVLLPPLFDLLLNVELSVALAVPVDVAEADSVVPEPLAALFVVLALVPDAVSVSPLVCDMVTLIAPLDEDALVAPLAAVSLLDEVAVLVFAALLLALWLASDFMLSVELSVELLRLELLSLRVSISEVLRFEADTSLSVDVLLSISEDEWVSSDVVFAPCE